MYVRLFLRERLKYEVGKHQHRNVGVSLPNVSYIVINNVDRSN